MSNNDFQELAYACLKAYYDARIGGVLGPLHDDEIYTVWMVKVLGNNKALLATTREDGLYFEITYNGAANEVYLDHYAKVNNEVIVGDDEEV